MPSIAPFIGVVTSTFESISVKVIAKDKYQMNGLVLGVDMYYRLVYDLKPFTGDGVMKRTFLMNHTTFFQQKYITFVLGDLKFYSYYEFYLQYFTSIGPGIASNNIVIRTKQGGKDCLLSVVYISFSCNSLTQHFYSRQDHATLLDVMYSWQLVQLTHHSKEYLKYLLYF